jgi:hypothetical protein
MQQLKISLPDGTRAALDEASAKSGRSLAEEIRERLAWSFEYEALEKPTRDLLYAVKELGALFPLDTGHDWATTLKGRQALGLTIQGFLESGAPTDGGATEDLFGPGDPQTVSRILLRHFERYLKTKAETGLAETGLDTEGFAARFLNERYSKTKGETERDLRTTKGANDEQAQSRRRPHIQAER